MDEETIIKEANEIKIGPEKPKSPIFYIMAPLFILLILFMVIPYYSIKLDPEPKNIPSIDEVIPKDLAIESVNHTIKTRADFLKFIQPQDPIVKKTADRIISLSCETGRICHAKALFYFVRDKFSYASDPTSFEYVKSAPESLYYRVGDCDDASVLLANLLQSEGINTRFVFVPEHIYVQAYLPEALYKYKKNDWVSLDPTCKGCKFGEAKKSEIISYLP